MSEEKKVKPVVDKSKVVSSKKTMGKRFKEAFIQEDVNSVKNYILFDCIMPGVKNLILDTISMFFFNETIDRRGGRRDDRGRSRTSYSSYYDKGKSRSSYSKREEKERRDDNVDYRSIILRDRKSAEDVLAEMEDRIERYGSVSVMELLDMIGEVSSYQDTKWGWDDKRDLRIRRVSSGFLIDIPEARFLEER